MTFYREFLPILLYRIANVFSASTLATHLDGRSADETLMVHECTSLLSTLSAVEDQSCWRMASSVAAIPNMVIALQRYRHEPEIARSVCSTIANLSLTSPVAEAFRDANGVAAIIGTMRTNRRKAIVQASACMAISSLSQTRVGVGLRFRQSLVEARACRAIAKAVRARPRDAELAEQAVGALLNLSLCHEAAHQRTMIRHGAWETLLALMDAFPDVEREAQGALANLQESHSAQQHESDTEDSGDDEPPAPRLLINLCQTCQTAESPSTKLMVCARCKIVRYCSRECQAADWKRGHKKQCVAE